MFARSLRALRPKVSVAHRGLQHTITTVDALPSGNSGRVATYLMTSGKLAAGSDASIDVPPTAAFVETNTSNAVPHMMKALEEEGLTPDHVKYIIVTHVHLDHAAGAGTLLGLCKNASVVCHPRAERHLVDPSKLLASAKTVYPDEETYRKEVGDMIACDKDRVIVRKDGESLKLHPDRPLRFLNVEGHARHHFAVHDPISGSCFSGDSFGASYDWMAPYGVRPGTLFPTTSPTDFDHRAAVDSANKIASLPLLRRVFPTHFGALSEIEEGRLQMIRLLPILEGIRREVLVMLGFGASEERAMRFAKAGVRFVLQAHLRDHGLVPEKAPRDLFANADLLKMDVEVNAQGLVVAAQRDKNLKDIRDWVRSLTEEDIGATFPFLKEVFRVTPHSTNGHVLAMCARAGASLPMLAGIAKGAVTGAEYLEFVREFHAQSPIPAETLERLERLGQPSASL